MPKWEYFNANKGIHAWRWDTEFYDITQYNTNRIVLEYNEAKGGPFEEDRFPDKIVFLLKGATTYVPTEGDQAGETQYTGGKIAGVRMFSESGDLQIKVTNANVPLHAVQAWLNRDGDNDFERAFGWMEQFASTHIGSNKGGSTWDEILTGFRNDKVFARGGNDFIVDGGGKDLYNGGGGWDVVSYNQWFFDARGMKHGITADLVKGTIKGPDGFIDKVVSIEEVRGTFLRDVLKGNKFDNEFSGMAGNDLIDGRGGWDRVRYDNDDNRGGDAGIRANMKSGKIKDGFGTVDTVRNIESVSGTDTHDVFRDNGKWMSFSGRDGDDLFKIYGGDDWINGDDGADTFRFYGLKFGADHVDDFDASEGDVLKVMAASSAADLTLLSRDGGNDTLIRFNKDSEIYLEDVAFGTMSASDFV